MHTIVTGRYKPVILANIADTAILVSVTNHGPGTVFYTTESNRAHEEELEVGQSVMVPSNQGLHAKAEKTSVLEIKAVM